MVREEISKKPVVKKREYDDSDEYKRQIQSLSKQNTDLLSANSDLMSKNEALLTTKETLLQQINSSDKTITDNAFQVKELNLKYQAHIADLEKRIKDFNISIYK